MRERSFSLFHLEDSQPVLLLSKISEKKNVQQREKYENIDAQTSLLLYSFGHLSMIHAGF